MMKFKAKVKNNQLIVKAKISSDEIISEREIDILENNNIRGFLKPKQSRRKLFEYTGPEGISMNDHLKNPITKYEFFYIMAQIIDATKKIQNNNLFLNNLILDLRHVYINENTKEMQFIYLPVVSNHLCLNVTGFMESIAYIVKPAANEDLDFVAKYASFIKSLNNFDVLAIENYISREDKDVARQIKKQNIGQSGFITDKPKDYYEHYSEKPKFDNDATGLLNEDEGTSLLDEGEDEATGLLDPFEDEATGLLEDSYVTIEDAKEYVHFASLERVSTKETININKPVFRFGKEQSYVDYFISNNNAISRSHADIITRGKRYFVYDQNSTNHTYINDEMLSVKVEVEIFEGDLLRFANEEFIFHI